MAIATQILLHADGFDVEVGDTVAGFVEEIWLGGDEEPQALALRTSAGRHGLLLADDVAIVDEEQHRVAVREGARLLALEPPHLVRRNGRLEATWTTTGERFDLVPAKPERPPLAARLPHPEHYPTQRTELRSLAFSIGVLYGGLAVLAFLLMGLCFLVADIVAGRAY